MALCQRWRVPDCQVLVAQAGNTLDQQHVREIFNQRTELLLSFLCINILTTVAPSLCHSKTFKILAWKNTKQKLTIDIDFAVFWRHLLEEIYLYGFCTRPQSSTRSSSGTYLPHLVLINVLCLAFGAYPKHDYLDVNLLTISSVTSGLLRRDKENLQTLRSLCCLEIGWITLSLAVTLSSAQDTSIVDIVTQSVSESLSQWLCQCGNNAWWIMSHQRWSLKSW